jgi:hypothetical protein
MQLNLIFNDVDLQDMLKSMTKVKTRMAGDAQNTQELVRYYLETVKGV